MTTRSRVHDPLTVSQERLRRRMLGVCEAVGEFIEYWGFKAIHGRVWTLLAVHHTPLTQIQIARLLGVSRSLVSGSVSELVRLGLIRATHNSRNTPYEAVIDVWPTITEVLRGREWMLIESTRIALEGAVDELAVAQEEGKDIEWDIDRIRFLLTMTEVAQTFVRMLLRIRTAPTLDTFGRWFGRATDVVRRLRS